MNLLAIECTHQLAAVAVKNGNRIVERASTDWQKAAEAILPLVVQAMGDAGLVPAELDGVAVSAGPGSFTALRIGMSAAKGIAYGAGCPLVPIPTLHAMAAAACNRTEATCIVPLIPSRPGEYFYAIYLRPAASCALEEIGHGREMAAELVVRLKPFAGDFSVTVRDLSGLESLASELSSGALDATFFTASSLLDMAEQVLVNGRAASLAEASPDYRQIFVPLQKKQ
ncbi:MAG: tRNA (adenosine(37)-N6)-threonylcarbamoyltransferase complex dimerization subunit type 1 TsaB [Chlorobiaceae bacterium]|nr:tRNA (adenosine(37)-N6)-threonylcarbamoyltransferase complex dimerization subunit type 1 TsaB [Chlorobiaceae bacterium]NTW73233.1 tRNA (adenosine(37)-N6)-threonylcarbamoyltransferase complex dimerization subunit type 1 TsaB [Chlorobiaceae bacterium]